MPVLPGHYDGHFVPMNGALFNVALRVGTVQQAFYPEDENNVSKRFMEYQVLVQHRANGTAVTKMYEHCIAIDNMASIADFDHYTFRAENVATREDGSQFRPGNGAHVILLCLNGESNNAVILGGIRHSESAADRKVDGHNRHSRFNGIDVVINKDGEFVLTYQGAQKVDGTPKDDVDQDGLGTFVKIDKLGNVTVSDNASENVFFIDRVNGKVKTTAKTEIDHVAPKVRIGDNVTDDPAVGGNELKGLLEEILDAITKIQVPTATGPSGTPLNTPEFISIRRRLSSMLSETVFVKK